MMLIGAYPELDYKSEFCLAVFRIQLGHVLIYKIKARNLALKTIRTIATATALIATMFAAPAHAQDRYLGDIIEFGHNFCPTNTLPTDGRELKVNENTSLFSLLGTNYGGDGRRTFRLPLISRTDDNGKKITTCIVTRGIFPSRSR